MSDFNDFLAGAHRMKIRILNLFTSHPIVPASLFFVITMLLLYLVKVIIVSCKI